MKKAALALLAAVACFSANAEWKRFLTGTESNEYYDPSSIRVSGDQVRVWWMSDYAQPQKAAGIADYSSLKTLFVIDCKLDEKASRTSIFNPGRMGSGTPLATDQHEPLKFTPIVPESVPSYLREIVCRS